MQSTTSMRPTTLLWALAIATTLAADARPSDEILSQLGRSALLVGRSPKDGFIRIDDSFLGSDCPRGRALYLFGAGDLPPAMLAFVKSPAQVQLEPLFRGWPGKMDSKAVMKNQCSTRASCMLSDDVLEVVPLSERRMALWDDAAEKLQCKPWLAETLPSTEHPTRCAQLARRAPVRSMAGSTMPSAGPSCGRTIPRS